MLPYLSTRIPGIRNKQLIQSNLLAEEIQFEISGIQDSGDLSFKSDYTVGKFIGDDFTAILPNGLIVIGDGVAPVHNPSEGTPYFGAYPYGLLPGLILENIALTATNIETACDVFQRANTTLGDLYKGLGLAPYAPHKRGGACFVIAKFGSQITELIGGGDTFALWELTDSTCGWFNNQVFKVDQARLQEFDRQIKRAMADHGDTAHQVVWSDSYYGAYFKESRDLYTNNPSELNAYAILDGAPFSQIKPLIQSVHLPTDSLKWLMIATDGCFPVKWSQDMEVLFQRVKAYIDGNLDSEDIFKLMRNSNLTSPASHTSEPELTFLIIKSSSFFSVSTV